MIFRNSLQRVSKGLSTSATHHLSSINKHEIEHFSRLSSLWWDEHGEFGLLHKMNPVRMQFIRQKLLETARDDKGEDVVSESKVLAGLDVLDVGCGGGLLSEVRSIRRWFHSLFTLTHVEPGAPGGAYNSYRCVRVQYCNSFSSFSRRPSSKT